MMPISSSTPSFPCYVFYRTKTFHYRRSDRRRRSRWRRRSCRRGRTCHGRTNRRSDASTSTRGRRSSRRTPKIWTPAETATEIWHETSTPEQPSRQPDPYIVPRGLRTVEKFQYSRRDLGSNNLGRKSEKGLMRNWA